MYQTTFEQLQSEYPALDRAMQKIVRDEPLSIDENRAAAAFFGSEALLDIEEGFHRLAVPAARLAAHHANVVIRAEIKQKAMAGLIYSDEYQGERFTYAYRNRPFGIGHQPKGFIIGSYDSCWCHWGRWGTIEYPFRLTKDEIDQFELVEAWCKT
jgi:Defence against restriction A C-terminal